MNPAEFSNYLSRLSGELSRMEADLPDIVGTEAVNHFKQSFIDGGFTDAVLEKWATRKTKYGNATKDGKEVLTQSGDLADSIIYTGTPEGVEISTDKAYAQVHNEGGTITIPVTRKMRAWAWAMYYNSGKTNELYKRLALTSKTKLTIIIPKRKFIGDSEVLDAAITDKIERTINSIFDI